MPAQSIYIVYYLLLCGLLACISYIVDLIFKSSRKELLYTIFFPPYMLVFIYKNFFELKNVLILIILFFITITFVGLIGNKPFALETLEILLNIFIWPIYLIKTVLTAW